MSLSLLTRPLLHHPPNLHFATKSHKLIPLPLLHHPFTTIHPLRKPSQPSQPSKPSPTQNSKPSINDQKKKELAKAMKIMSKPVFYNSVCAVMVVLCILLYQKNGDMMGGKDEKKGAS